MIGEWERMSKAYWIWYPGDWELWLHEKISVEREMRGAIYPAYWRLDGHYSSVMYKYTYELDHSETIEITADGDFAIFIDGQDNYRTNQRTFRLPVGKHEITITVYNRAAVPALYVEGKTVYSNHQWQVSCYDQTWKAVGHWKSTLHQAAVTPANYRLPTQTYHPVSMEQRSDSLMIDFGKETFGYIELDQIQGSGEIMIYYGESLEEAEDHEHCVMIDQVQITEDTERYTLEKSRAFRYVQIVSNQVSIGDISMQYEYLPVAYRSKFHSSDALLNQIWETSLYTFHLNTREFFLDGIKRDRWVWSGDSYQSFLMNYYSFFDQDAVKRTLIALRGKDPIKSHLNTILDYSLYWFVSIYDYYMYSGDIEFVKGQYENMVSLMDFCLNRRNENGMMEGIESDWVFVDWADLDNRGEVSTIQILLCRSLEAMAMVAGLMKDGERQNLYVQEATLLKEKVLMTFWNEEKGGLVHHCVDGEQGEKVTKYPNMFALMFGYLTPAQAKSVKENILLNEEVQPITTPFMRFFELAALCEIGEQPLVLSEMLDYWGGMLDLGATSFWEVYDPKQSGREHLAMYGMPYGKSLCHAWGASPIYLIGKYFLGVRPLSAGYETFVIEPQLGGLAWFEGTIPIHQGEVEIQMNQDRIKVKSNYGKGILKYGFNEQNLEAEIPSDGTWVEVRLS